MEPFLEEIVRSPRLMLYQRYIDAVLSDEQKKREQFYEQIREDQKAEFINGEVIVHSPVKIEHNIVGKLLLELLDMYVRIHRLGFVGYEKMLISLTRNDYEPDICFWKKEKASAFTPRQTRFPAPDFIAEILSERTEKIDRSIKYDDYAAHGVGEYWIIDPVGETIEKYILKSSGTPPTYPYYELALKVRTGLINSDAVAGFEIPARAVFDENENLAALRKILSGSGFSGLKD